VDLGSRDDYTALSVVAGHPADDLLTLVRLERIRHRPYPEIIRMISRVMAALPEDSHLLVDATGVGAPVVDELSAQGVRHTRILIHGGVSVNRLDDGTRSVPKRDLIAALQVRFEAGTLAIPRGLRHAETLEREALAFEMKISAAGHDSYGARSGEHDDLLLAVSMPVWWRRHLGRPGVWFI
jgi:hypothetical protein